MNIIVAIAENRVIGKRLANHGSIPWKIPSDMKRFRDITWGHTVIMGRGTWESLPARFRPLPGRKNIVVSQQGIGQIPRGVVVVPSLSESVQLASTEIFVIGGAQLYEEALFTTKRLLVTHVFASVDGDVYFPQWNKNEWRIEREEPRKRSAGDEFDTQFIMYERL